MRLEKSARQCYYVGVKKGRCLFIFRISKGQSHIYYPPSTVIRRAGVAIKHDRMRKEPLMISKWLKRCQPLRGIKDCDTHLGRAGCILQSFRAFFEDLSRGKGGIRLLCVTERGPWTKRGCWGRCGMPSRDAGVSKNNGNDSKSQLHQTMKQNLCYTDMPWCVLMQCWRYSAIVRMYVQTATLGVCGMKRNRW